MGCCLSKSLAVQAATVVTLVSSMGHAESPGPIDLRWQAPNGCPPASRVLREIARLVGTSPRQVQARAIVSREAAARFRVRVELSGDATGKRTLTADSCDSAARATGLIIALAIAPQAASVLSDEMQQGDARATQAPATDTGELPPASPPSPTPQSGPQGMRLHGLLFSGVLAEQALVPGLAMGVLVGGGLHLEWLRADLSCSLVPFASANAPSAPSRGADFTTGALTLRLCPGVASAAVGLFACAALRATRLWAVGTGVPEARAAHTDVLAAALGGIVRWPGDSAWAVELEMNLVAPFSRPEFVIENVGQVYRPGPAGASGALALGHRF